jgi:hypothetical protein
MILYCVDCAGQELRGVSGVCDELLALHPGHLHPAGRVLGLRAPPLRPRQNTIPLRQGGQGSYTFFEFLRSGLDIIRYLCVKKAKVCTLSSGSSAPASTEHDVSASRRPRLYTCFQHLRSGLNRTRYLCVKEAKVCTLASSSSAPVSTEHDISASRRPRFVHFALSSSALVSTEHNISVSRRPTFVHLLRAPPLQSRQNRYL